MQGAARRFAGLLCVRRGVVAGLCVWLIERDETHRQAGNRRLSEELRAPYQLNSIVAKNEKKGAKK